MFALERISFQLKSKLGHSLYTLTKQTMNAIDTYIQSHGGNVLSTEVFDTITSTYLAEWSAACDEVIFKETGIQSHIVIDPTIEPSTVYSAWVSPGLTKQNAKPILDSIFNIQYRSTLGQHDNDPIETLKNVDTTLGRAKNIPKGFKANIGINISFFIFPYLSIKGTEVLDSMRPEHITATLIHEVGHAFSYIEYLGVVISETNAFRDRIEALSKNPQKLKDETEKIILKYVSDPSLVKEYETLTKNASKLPDDQEVYLNTLTLSSLYTKMTTAFFFSQSSEAPHGTTQAYTDQVYTPYTKTMVERIADDFVTSHGFGSAMAEALRIGFQFDISWTNSSVRSLPITGYLFVRALQEIFPNPNLMDGETVYEHPVERLRQLEMNYIDLIKLDDLDSQVRNEYLNQIKIIRTEIKKMEKIWAPEESRFMLRLMKKISSFSSGLLANANLVADYAALQRLTKHFIQNPVYYHAQALKNVIKGSSRKG